MACVPILLLTGFQFVRKAPSCPSIPLRYEFLCHISYNTSQGTNTPELIKLPSKLSIRALPLNLGTIAAIVYSGLYIALEPVAGAAITPLLIGGAALANKATAKYGAVATKASVGIHVVSWILQFIGHGKFEGRAPALLDNLVQALFLAPFFVWLEALFKLGYRPELRARLELRVREELLRLKTLKEAKAAKEAEK